MNEPTVQSAVSDAKRRRLRFGMRGLIGVVLLLGLIFGWLARMQREAVQREAVVAELARDRIVVNSREPTLLCLVLTKLRGSRNILRRLRPSSKMAQPRLVLTPRRLQCR